jgi:hypothetical protein
VICWPQGLPHITSEVVTPGTDVILQVRVRTSSCRGTDSIAVAVRALQAQCWFNAILAAPGTILKTPGIQCLQYTTCIAVQQCC